MSDQEAEKHNARKHNAIHVIDKISSTHKRTINFDWILDRIGGVDSKILASENLKKQHASLIDATPLRIAHHLHKPDIFKILLDNGTDFILKNHQEKSVIHQILNEDCAYACQKQNSVECIQLILSHQVKSKINSNPCDKNGISHFHVACMINHTDAVLFFINNGILIDETVNFDSPFSPGCTALHIAVKFGNLAVIKVLLRHNANVYLKDVGDMTAWDILLQQNMEFISETDKKQSNFKCFSLTNIEKNEEIIEYLIDKNLVSSLNFSHLHAACTLTDTLVVEQILKNSHFGINEPVPDDSPIWPGYTPLHLAIRCNFDTAKLLLKKGADLEIKDLEGVTPFDLYLQRHDILAHQFEFILSQDPVWKNTLLSDRETKLIDLVAAMRSSSFEKFVRKTEGIEKLYIPYFFSTWSGYTILHLAVIFVKDGFSDIRCEISEKSFKVLKMCLTKGADVTAKPPYSYSPLHLAFRLDKTNLIKLLLEYHEKSINPIDSDGLSHLHIACAFGNLKVVEKLLSSGAKVNLVFRGQSAIASIQPGWTPLHIAVARNKCEIARKLLNYGADIYLRDIQGMTPIHLVQPTKYHKEMATTLSAVISKDSVSNVGLSHLHIATFANDLAAVKKLLQNGADANQIISYELKKSNAIGLEYLRDYENYTPMDFGMDNNCQTEIFDVLFEHGARFFVFRQDESLPSWKESNNLYDKRIRPIARSLEQNLNLQKLIDKENGLSMLHIACYEGNLKLVEKLLESDVNVNQQCHPLSPIWPGCSPLHVLLIADLTDLERSDKVQRIIMLFLEKGANVNLLNSQQQSPLHIAFRGACEDVRKGEPEISRETLRRINSLLKHQKNYNVNPVDQGGLSHFHIACCINNDDVVEEFLKEGVDVNQSLTFLLDQRDTGSSPLHLSVKNMFRRFVDDTDQEKTIAILLEYGANLLANDAFDNTPLHICADDYTSGAKLFMILIKAGADVNARNLKGETAFEMLVEKHHFLTSCDRKTETEKLIEKCFFKMIPYFSVKHGQFNSFNPIHNTGYLGKLICHPTGYFEKILILDVIQNYPNMMITERGRTIIHNITSIETHSEHEYYRKSYADMINKFTELGCDVNHRDDFGRTALHVAAYFHNHYAAAELLEHGADLNIIDEEGQTPIEYIFKTCNVCNVFANESNEIGHFLNDDKHFSILKVFIVHVNKLRFGNLDINQRNENLVTNISERFDSSRFVLSQSFFEELYDLDNFIIDPYSLSLNKFMSETQAVIEYPFMTEEKRKAIDNYFRSPASYVRLSKVVGLLKLQYWKASNRMRILQEANDSLTALIGFQIPYLCTRIIFDYLKNSELQNLIESSNIDINREERV